MAKEKIIKVNSSSNIDELWLALILIAVIVSIIIGNCEISVTNMRVSGKAVFKTRVDLPIASLISRAQAG